ncbi:MAG TPA: ribose-5-phosphate isomerase RpiA [Planctomycetia bacterium]|nr:ribose-5-phosphate isomerase RpiA [Planctomycetia bacterium]
MDAKTRAAHAAADRVTSGMTLGLGTGSTAALFVAELGRRVQAGTLRDLVGVATSRATAALAKSFGIALVDEDDCPALDLAIDGADEIDPSGDAVKGRGGALLREKVVVQAARRFLCIADESKLVPRLGSTGPLPVEVVPYAWKARARWLGLWGDVTLRERDGKPFVTDNGNMILDVSFADGIHDPESLQAELSLRAGIAEHGLFLHCISEAIIGREGGVEVRTFG